MCHRHRTRRIGWMPAVLVAAAALVAAAPIPASARTTEPVTLSERSDRLIVQLDNGLLVIAQRIPTAPVVSVQCWVKTGSIYEQQHNGAGLSHFLEHLVSGGTTANRTEEQSTALLGRIGAQVNASTSLDTVRYYINTAAEHADTAIDLISDWMNHSLITPQEFQRERQVILREFQMGRGDPSRIFWKLTQQARYRRHPARHPIIGYEDEFRSITRDEIYDFYKRMYVPNNMVLVIVGDVEPRRIVNRVAELWEDAEPGELPAVRFPEEPPIDAPRRLTGEADIERSRLRLAWPGVRLTTEHDYPLDLLGHILGAGELGRLVRTVRDEKQLVTSIDAYNFSTSWAEGFFAIDAVVERDKIEQARRAILEVVEGVIDEGITEAELRRAQRRTVADAVYDVQTAHAAAQRLVSDLIHTGDPDYLDRYVDAVQRVTAEQVQTAAAKFLRDDRLITVELLPLEGEPTPLARPEDEPLPEDVEQETVRLDNGRLVELMRQAERTAAPARAAEVGPLRMHTLPNGLRLVLQRNTRLPAVAMQWYHLGGLMADRPGQEGLANAMAEMMMKGAADLTADDIARRLEDLGAEMSASCGNSTFYITALCLGGDWPTVLDLMADVVQRPTFPADEWEKMKPRLLAAIDSINDQWYTQLRYAFREAYFGADHPWSRPTVGRREVVESLTPERLRRFHRDRISATSGVLAVFGDIDEQRVIDRVTDHFADLPAEPAVPFEPLDRPDIEPGYRQVTTAKPMAAVTIGYGPGLKRNNPDYPAVEVMNRVLSSFPAGWFEQALRGQGQGLVYAVGSGLMTGAAPGYWGVLFNTQPDTVQPAVARTLEVIDRIRSETVDEATLQRARTAAVISEALSRQSNAQRAGAVALDELYGLGYDHAEMYIQRLREVDAAAVRDVARRYLRRPLALILTNQPVDVSELPPLTTPAPAPGTAPGTAPVEAAGTDAPPK